MFTKAMSGVRDISRGGGLVTRVMNTLSPRVHADFFDLGHILHDACNKASIPLPSNPSQDLPHYRWWEKLCAACTQKPMSKHGSHLLRTKLVNALSQSLAIEEVYRLNDKSISKHSVHEPIIVMGLPRSNGHMAAHVLSRSGLFLAPRQCDTLSPSLMAETQRLKRFNATFRGFHYVNPDFACVRMIKAEQIDDDLTLHLMTPQSYAWGLLHGLDEYLLECFEEDQTPVYAQIKRVMQLFQWYKACGHFHENVVREFEPIDNPIEWHRYGTKVKLTQTRHLLYSPFAILNSDALYATFPDMRVVWVHRAIAQCIPSLCSALCLHNALYTGKRPTEGQLASMGEKVLGIFGSGTDNAIEFYRNFDQRRMVHWSNRDCKRHATRLAQKTLTYFDINMDRYRRIQMINGQTEYLEGCRPMHDAQLPYFSLHEGIVNEVFKDYIRQFEEFAFEERMGITRCEYKSISPTSQQALMGGRGIASKDSYSDASALGSGQRAAGHYLQDYDRH